MAKAFDLANEKKEPSGVEAGVSNDESLLNTFIAIKNIRIHRVEYTKSNFKCFQGNTMERDNHAGKYFILLMH